jgi:hypothetical protein
MGWVGVLWDAIASTVGYRYMCSWVRAGFVHRLLVFPAKLIAKPAPTSKIWLDDMGWVAWVGLGCMGCDAIAYHHINYRNAVGAGLGITFVIPPKNVIQNPPYPPRIPPKNVIQNPPYPHTSHRKIPYIGMCCGMRCDRLSGGCDRTSLGFR